MRELLFHPEVSLEIKSAYVWYQKQAEGFLVPKLCLGTHTDKLCLVFSNNPHREYNLAKRSLKLGVPKQSLGTRHQDILWNMKN